MLIKSVYNLEHRHSSLPMSCMTLQCATGMVLIEALLWKCTEGTKKIFQYVPPCYVRMDCSIDQFNLYVTLRSFDLPPYLCQPVPVLKRSGIHGDRRPFHDTVKAGVNSTLSIPIHCNFFYSIRIQFLLIHFFQFQFHFFQFNFV